MTRCYVANPNDKGFWRHRYLFQFNVGAWPAAFVIAYANALDDALEEAAVCLSEKASGLLTSFEDAADLCNGDPFECDGFTYTESGFLDAEYWSVREDPSNAEIVAAQRS